MQQGLISADSGYACDMAGIILTQSAVRMLDYSVEDCEVGSVCIISSAGFNSQSCVAVLHLFGMGCEPHLFYTKFM
jgi:hypothetical protein